MRLAYTGELDPDEGFEKDFDFSAVADLSNSAEQGFIGGFNAPSGKKQSAGDRGIFLRSV